METDAWEEFKNGRVKIEQTIYVQRPTQKAIVLGKRGQQIKQIREETQKELEEMLGQRVHLFLFVKVRENWIEDPERYQSLGLDFRS